jgi:cytochrome c5
MRRRDGFLRILVLSTMVLALSAGRASGQVYCGPADVAFVVDDTFSTGPVLTSLKASLPAILDRIAASTDPGTGAGPDYRIALVTFKDDVAVRLNFGDNNASGQANATEFAQLVASLSANGGGPGSGNASDEALNTAIMSLAASDRLPGQQTGDFTPPFRGDFSGLASRRIIVLLTGFQPGGFDDDFRTEDAINAHQRALDAAAASIQIVAIFTPAIEAQQGAAPVLIDYASTTGGAYVRTDEPPIAPGVAILNALATCPAVNKPPLALCGSAFEAAVHPQCDAVPASIDNGSYDPEDALNVLLEQLPPPPYAVGATGVTLTVTDSQGASATCQAPVTVLCTPPDTTPPTVSLAAPPPPVTGVVTLSATATDNSGVMQVEFFAGATSLGVDVMDPYTLTWNTSALAQGTIVTLRAVATDTANLTAESTVTVTIEHPVPRVTVSSTPVLPGASVVATIANGPGNRTDWVAVFGAGSTYLEWKYLNGLQTAPAAGVTGAAVPFILPMTVGTYTVRFYAGAALLATSGPITVAIPTDISVAVTPATVVAGGTVAATVANGPGNSRDWLALYATGGSTYLVWKYLNGSQTVPDAGVTSATVPFTMPTTPGTYTVRLHSGRVLLATSVPITVVAPAPSVLTVGPTSVSPLGTVTATVASGPGNATDWLALYAEGGSTYLDWKYLNGSKTRPASGMTAATVDFTMPATPGTYTVRLHAGMTLLATSEPITVTSIVFTVSATTVAPGGTVTATMTNGPGNPRDWIGVYAAGPSTYGAFLDWKYLNGSKTAPASGLTSAAVLFAMPTSPGTYILKFYAGATLLATSSAVITQ